MNTEILLLALAAIAILAVAGTLIARSVHKHRIASAPVLMGEAMRRRGITPKDAEAAGVASEVLAGARQCAACKSEPQCRAMMLEASGRELPHDCPNAQLFGYIEGGRTAGGQ